MSLRSGPAPRPHRFLVASASLALAAGLLLPANAAFAASEEPAPASAEEPSAGDRATVAPILDEILVTGEKRETRLQDIPVAITAIDQATLTARNTRSLDDLGGVVPGLNITRNQGAERVVTIRGIGYETSSNPNSFPGVAFHINGVYIAHTMTLAQDLIDIDRIEVLRGPQGTVFGETSTGGAINVILKRPELNEFSGRVGASYGSYDYTKAEFAFNLPASETLALRVAAQYVYQDGFGYSIGVPGVDKYRLDDLDNLTGRAALLWQPSDRFSAVLEGYAFNADHAGALQKSIVDTTPGNRVVDQDLPAKYKLDTAMVDLTLTADLSDTVQTRSVTAYQYMHHWQISEGDRTSNPDLIDHLLPWEDKSRTFSEEVTLSSIGPQIVEWTVGGLYLRQRALQNIYEISAPCCAAAVDPLTGQPVKFQTDSPFQHTSIGVYGQAIFHATDALTVTGGARYSWDKVTAQPYQFFYEVPPRQSKSDAITGKLSVDYKLTPVNSIYITASRGYKPSGVSFVSDLPFMPGSFTSGPAWVPQTFKKEIVDALEIGSKNEFFGRTLRLNLAAYYYKYKDYQFTAEDPVPFAGGTDNIPKADVWGAEAEMTWQATSALQFDGTFGWGKGEFKSHKQIIDAQTAALIRSTKFAELGYPFDYYYNAEIEAAVAAGAQDVYGKRIPKMPEYQGTFAATYTAPVASGELRLRGEVIYRGKYNYRVFGIGLYDRVPAYTIYNAYISYTPDNQPWRLSLTGTNLGDKDAIASRFADPYGSGTTSVEYIPPRQIIGSIIFDF